MYSFHLQDAEEFKRSVGKNSYKYHVKLALKDKPTLYVTAEG